MKKSRLCQGCADVKVTHYDLVVLDDGNKLFLCGECYEKEAGDAARVLYESGGRYRQCATDPLNVGMEFRLDQVFKAKETL